MSRRISQLKNLGPKSDAWLVPLGIATEDDLRAIGAVAAFLRLRAAGRKVSLNALYALDAALSDIHWLDLPPERKRELKAAAAFGGEDI